MMSSEEPGPTDAWCEVGKNKYASGAIIPAGARIQEGACKRGVGFIFRDDKGGKLRPGDERFPGRDRG